MNEELFEELEDYSILSSSKKRYREYSFDDYAEALAYGLKKALSLL